MPKKRKTPESKSSGAPAYMAQYTALMTILLAFFIVMLTMGQDRVAQYKVGVGLIQDMFSMRGGGMGVLPFWRSLTRGLPQVDAQEDPSDDASLVGHHHQTITSLRLDVTGMRSIQLENMANTFRLRTPMSFENDQVIVSADYVSVLEQAAAILYALDGYRITVCVVVDGDDVRADRMLASRRAAWVMRYLIDQGRIPPERLRAAGYGDLKYLNGETDVGELFFTLRRG